MTGYNRTTMKGIITNPHVIVNFNLIQASNFVLFVFVVYVRPPKKARSTMSFVKLC